MIVDKLHNMIYYLFSAAKRTSIGVERKHSLCSASTVTKSINNKTFTLSSIHWCLQGMNRIIAKSALTVVSGPFHAWNGVWLLIKLKVVIQPTFQYFVRNTVLHVYCWSICTWFCKLSMCVVYYIHIGYQSWPTNNLKVPY